MLWVASAKNENQRHSIGVLGGVGKPYQLSGKNVCAQFYGTSVPGAWLGHADFLLGVF